MRTIRNWSVDSWRDLAGESGSHRRERNPEDTPVRRGVPVRNARSSAHSTRRPHDRGGSRGAVSDRYQSWWPEGFDSARSGSRRGQDPAGEETGSILGKDSHRHAEDATRGIRGMRLLHCGWLPILNALRAFAAQIPVRSNRFKSFRNRNPVSECDRHIQAGCPPWIHPKRIATACA